MVPPVFLKVTRLVFLRLTRISTVCVVARLIVVGRRLRCTVKGRVLVAVKRRRSARIVRRGDGVLAVRIVRRGDGVLAVQCGSVQRRQQLVGVARLGASVPRVKVRVGTEF